MKLAYSYIRFSRKEQATGDSLRRQTEATEAWCTRNDVQLDTSTKLQDLGVSAFTGQHASNPDKFALAAFLELLEKGKVPRGSYLICENLDRLTRQDVWDAIELVGKILKAGVSIVQLRPETVYSRNDADPMKVMMLVMELSRGHGESLRKSDIVGRAWKKRKERAALEKVPVTKMCPGWLEVVDGEYRCPVEKKKVVQQIFRWALEGMGVGPIAKKLNAEGIPPFGCARMKSDRQRALHQWQKSSVGRLLKNKAVIGEYQPHAGSKKRVPVGDPVPGYYPVVITEDVFWAVQAALSVRRRQAGRGASRAKNLFVGLVRGVSGDRFALDGKGKTDMLANWRKTMSAGEYEAIKYGVFEKSVLASLREVSAVDLLGDGSSSAASKLAMLQDELNGTEERIAEFGKELYKNPKSATYKKLLLQAEAEKERILGEMATVRQEVATPVVEGLGECQGLIELLSKDSSEELRRRLRAKVGSVISEIRIGISKDNRVSRHVYLQVHFRHSSYVRHIVFKHKSYQNARGVIYPETVTIYYVTETKRAAEFSQAQVDFICNQAREKAYGNGEML